MGDPLDDALGLPPLEIERKEIVIPDPDAEYEFARKNIAEMIGKLGNATDELWNIATTSQHPRAFEVLNGMIKNYVDANKDMMNLKKLRNEAENISSSGGNVTNNTLVMTTEEVLRMLKK